MLFETTEMDVELVERGEELAEGGTFGELGEGVDVLREALAAVAELAVGPRHEGVSTRSPADISVFLPSTFPWGLTPWKKNVLNS